MDMLLPVLGILGALTVGMVSPGPSFIIVAKTAIGDGRGNALAVGLGLGVGSALFGLLALAGLHVVLEQVAWLAFAVKLAGGVFLIWLAWRIFKGASAPLVIAGSGPETTADGLVWHFLVGLATQISNPKTALVFASVFAVFLPGEPGVSYYLVLVPLILLLETGWYCLVALLLSHSRPKALYARSKSMVDRVASMVLGALGVRLISSAF